MTDQLEGIDFALAAYREEGLWQLAEITENFLTDVDAIARGLRRFPGDSGALGIIAVDEDFFLLVRVTGARVRILLSDITAAEEWELAQSALEYLHLPAPEEDDEQAPAGELDVVADLGMPAMDLAALIDDEDLYPDEVLSDLARRVGFGDLFDDAAGLTSA